MVKEWIGISKIEIIDALHSFDEFSTSENKNIHLLIKHITRVTEKEEEAIVAIAVAAVEKNAHTLNTGMNKHTE